MTVTASDEVLNISDVSTDVGNPMWMLLLVFLISALYVAYMILQLYFCASHINDMGFGAYAQLFSALGDKIGGFFGSFGSALKNGITDLKTGTDSGSSSVSSEKKMIGINGTGTKDPTPVNVRADGTTTNITVTKDMSSEKDDIIIDITNSSAYAASGQEADIGDTKETTEDINEQIKVGRDMQ
jgi:hypothetical protein